MLNIITNGYILPFISKPKLARVPLIHSGYKALQKDQVLAACIQSLLSKNAIEREENVKSPVSSRQASPKVEASNKPKQAQYLPTCIKVQNGNTRVHHNLSDFRGMGVVDRLVRCLASHPDPPKLKEVPKVLPQVTGVPVHSLPFGLATAPQVFPMIVKANGPDKGNQTSPVPRRLAYQGPVSGRSTSKHSDSGRPDSVLRVDNKSGKI